MQYKEKIYGTYIGVDGCKGGWIAAILKDDKLEVGKYGTINQLIETHSTFDAFLIDMAIGLQRSAEDLRPDDLARKLLVPRNATVFPVPARAAVYAEGEEAQKAANKKALGKSLAKQSMAIIPKIREVDMFLTEHSEYKNIICESHPELCFSRLNGSVVMSRKKEMAGFSERKQILARYLGKDQLAGLWDKAKELKCNPDDILDAVCLAFVGVLKAEGKCETIPGQPQKDEQGLYMQMTVPKIR